MPEITLLDFPKTEIDPNLLKLQDMVYEFITSVILKNDKFIFNLLSNMDQIEIFTTTNQTIIDMISTCTYEFYNNCYFDIQNNKENPLTQVIMEMTKFADYGPHILLDKLIRLTIDTHIDVDREKIIITDIELYNLSIYNQVYHYLCNRNIIHVLSKGVGDDMPFVNVPINELPFKIIFDKKIL